jgi:hypothetical protein
MTPITLSSAPHRKPSPTLRFFGVRDRGCNGPAEQPDQDHSFVVQRRPFSPIQKR